MIPDRADLLTNGFFDRRFHALEISGPFETGHDLAGAVEHDIRGEWLHLEFLSDRITGVVDHRERGLHLLGEGSGFFGVFISRDGDYRKALGAILLLKCLKMRILLMASASAIREEVHQDDFPFELCGTNGLAGYGLSAPSWSRLPHAD